MKKMFLATAFVIFCGFLTVSDGSVGAAEPSETPVVAEVPEIDPSLDAPSADFDKRRPGVEYGKIETIRYRSTTTDGERAALIIFPPNYDETKKYPVLYLLHGIGGDEREWLGGAPVEILGNLIADGKAAESLVVIPNICVRHSGVEKEPPFFSVEHFREFDKFLDELRDDLKPFIEKTYNVATDRDSQAIAGLSMGGREALYVGLTASDDFASIGAFEPAIGLLPYPMEPGLFKRETLAVPAQNKGKTFVMIVKGNRDTVVGDWPKIYAETLQTNGDAPYYLVLDGGHEFKVWKECLYRFAQKIFQ